MAPLIEVRWYATRLVLGLAAAHSTVAIPTIPDSSWMRHT
jgi:hypothetical protein